MPGQEQRHRIPEYTNLSLRERAQNAQNKERTGRQKQLSSMCPWPGNPVAAHLDDDTGQRRTPMRDAGQDRAGPGWAAEPP